MRKSLYLSAVFFAFIMLVSVFFVVSAQDDSCHFDGRVVETIETVCPAMGTNEVCYGNFEVNVVTQGDVPDDFNFTDPGDNANLAFVRSLFLSSLDPQHDRWGIAQMRLLANLTRGSQDITILLFGDVSVDNEVAPTTKLNVMPIVRANMRNIPTLNSFVIRTIPARQTVEAVGRLEDSSWLRVIVPENGAVGWVSADLLTPENETDTFEHLPIQSGSSPYFGPMQAISYSSGTSSTCSNFNVDGMLIQTPQGQARVTMLINEVSIEMVSTNQFGATAFVEANPEDGMTISVLTGSANVEAEGTAFFVNANMRTTIPLNDDRLPTDSPTFPTRFPAQEIQAISLLPALVDSSVPLGTNSVGANIIAPPPPANNTPTPTIAEVDEGDPAPVVETPDTNSNQSSSSNNNQRGNKR